MSASCRQTNICTATQKICFASCQYFRKYAINALFLEKNPSECRTSNIVRKCRDETVVNIETNSLVDKPKYVLKHKFGDFNIPMNKKKILK